MAPKTPKTPSDRPYGLNDNEVNVTIHACKLFAEDGKVDTEKLAQLTGHAKSHTAYCLWNNAKKKILSADSPASAPGAAAAPGGLEAPGTPTAGKGAAAKKRARASKNAAAVKNTDEEMMDEKAPKRVKAENLNDEQDPIGLA